MFPAPDGHLSDAAADSGHQFQTRRRLQSPEPCPGARRRLSFALRLLYVRCLFQSIVDRFLPALPPHLRPTDDYEIVSPRKKDVERFLQTLKAPPSNLGTSYQVGSLDPDAFVRDYVVGGPLSVSPKKPKRVETWAAQQVWKQFLKQTTSQLTFPMIGRLAEQLLRILPAMGRALRETYSYVLLDEFQDTTHVQYDFLCTAFLARPRS